MSTKHEAEIYIAMNEDGEYCAHEDEDAAREALSDGYGYRAVRIVKLTVKMSAPDVAAEEVEVDVPDGSGATEQAEASAE